MSKNKEKDTLSPLEGENQFLTKLVLGLLAISLFSWGYTAYYKIQIVSPSRAGLEAGDDKSIKETIALLDSTHFFSNVVVPDNLIPGEDPLLGGQSEQSALTLLSDEAVKAALTQSEKKAGEPVIGIRQALQDRTAAGSEKRTYFETTVPEVTNWLTLESQQFPDSSLVNNAGTATKKAVACASFAPCAKAYVERRRPRLNVFLKVAAARSGDTPAWSEGEVLLAHKYPTGLIRGFGTVPGDNPYSDTEKALLSSLVETQAVATENGTIFSAFISLVFFIALVTRFLSDRIKPQDYV